MTSGNMGRRVDNGDREEKAAKLRVHYLGKYCCGSLELIPMRNSNDSGGSAQRKSE